MLFTYLVIISFTGWRGHGGAILGLAFVLFILLESFTMPLLPPPLWAIRKRTLSDRPPH